MTKNSIQDKIVKLLKLAADNPNVNEAAVAFARAQELADRHALDLDDLIATDAEDTQEPPREVEKIQQRIIERCGKAVAWKTILAQAVAKANRCNIFLRSGSLAGGLVAYGQPSDLATVEYIYKAIAREVDKMAKRAVRDYKATDPEPGWDASPRSYGRSWRMGCSDTIADRFAALDAVETARDEVDDARKKAIESGDEQALASSTHALVRVNQAAEYVAEVEAAVSKYRDGLGLGQGRGFRGAGEGYGAGRRAGHSVNLGSGGKALKS